MPTRTELSASGERRPVDDKRDVDETLPRRNVGEICYPKGVRAGCSEVAADRVRWSQRRLIRERRRCLRCLLLVMCTYPFSKKALTLHLARGEGRERYLAVI